MKTQELTELRKLSAEKLNEELQKAQKELFETKFEVKNGQSKNIHLISKFKKYVAQIKTIQSNQ